MNSILIMELRGFAALATQLAKELDRINLSPERVRAAGIQIANQIIEKVLDGHHCTHKMHLGGDTWYFTFEDVTEGVIVGCKLLIGFYQKTIEKGIFYLKPSIGFTTGKPQFDGERFLDDDSIAAYRLADSGKSYRFAVIGEAINKVKQIPWIEFSDKIDKQGIPYLEIIWNKDYSEIKIDLDNFNVSLPSLLLDNEVIYSNSVPEAIGQLIRQQERSKNIASFGGPVPIDSPIYRQYLKSVIAILRNKSDVEWTILNYIPLDESFYSFAWLELCRKLSIYYPRQFATAFFPLPQGQMRPFSYHIFNKECVHIGLRSFSPTKGTPTMSSAIIFKNNRIAKRFYEEFIENWRRIGPSTDEQYSRLISNIKGLNDFLRKKAIEMVEEIISE